MSQGKIKIASTRDGHPSREPLMPVIEYWLANGGKIASNQSITHAFQADASGTTRLVLVGDISLQDILDAFCFPEHFTISSVNGDTIWDGAHHTKLILTTFEKEAQREVNRQRRKSESDTLLAEALKRRGKV